MNTPTLSPEEFNVRLKQGEAMLLIDVRTPVEFAEVHADNAVNIPFDRLTAEAAANAGAVDRTAPVYVICRGGHRSAKAAERLAGAGYGRPVVVAGGTLAWTAAGLPVVRGAAKMISLERQVRIAAGALVATGAVLAQVVHPGFIWLSGFVGAGLVFAGITDHCGMGLLIARLPWNRGGYPVVK